MGGFWPIFTHYMRVPFDGRGEYSNNCSSACDDIFAVAEKVRCDEFGRNLNRIVPVKNSAELR